MHSSEAKLKDFRMVCCGYFFDCCL